jgi:hypothetical protein
MIDTMSTYTFFTPAGRMIRYESSDGAIDQIIRHVEDITTAPDPESRAAVTHCLLRELDEAIGATRTEGDYRDLVEQITRPSLYVEPERDETTEPVRPTDQS